MLKFKFGEISNGQGDPKKSMDSLSSCFEKTEAETVEVRTGLTKQRA